MSNTKEQALEARITELEIKLTHQDRLLETLNDVVVEERKESSALLRRLDALEKVVYQLGESAANERPPHY